MVKLNLLWLPERLEDAFIREALQAYGKVTSISTENFKVADMEDLRTLNRDDVVSLAEGVGVGDVPHALTICGIQSLVLIPGRPPLCLRCTRVDHIRRHCRTPHCDDCRRFGHTVEECIVTYAYKLRHCVRPPEDVIQEHIMDATEVLDAAGVLSVATVDTATTANTTVVPQGDSKESKTLLRYETPNPAHDKEPATCSNAAKDTAPVTPATEVNAEEELAGQPTLPAAEAVPLVEEHLHQRKRKCASDASENDDLVSVKHRRRRRTSKHKGKCQRSRSRSRGGGPEATSPSPERQMQA